MVQEFLVQAVEEVEGEMAEDLSAGELQEKLKRLESLQELRLCNEDKVTTIERSAESEEVKKALQKPSQSLISINHFIIYPKCSHHTPPTERFTAQGGQVEVVKGVPEKL